jgi:murein peptide amidase A
VFRPLSDTRDEHWQVPAWRLRAAYASIAIGVAGLGVATAAAGPRIDRSIRLGSSVRGNAIVAVERGDPSGPKVLVVGCVHGNETAGIRIVKWLSRAQPPPGIDLWLLPDLNPDGVHTNTRGNAHGVDLNRNFPWHWRPLMGLFYSGSHPLSEPESRLAARLILRLRPRITIWFHQPLDVVDESGGAGTIERRYAQLAHLPLRRLTRFPGSVASWENARLPGSTAFVVELPAGRPSAVAIARYAHAVLAIASEARSARTR